MEEPENQELEAPLLLTIVRYESTSHRTGRTCRMVEELWAVPLEGVWLLWTRRSYDGGAWQERKTIATTDTEDEAWTFARAWRKEGLDHAELIAALDDDEWQAYQEEFFKEER